MSSLFVGVYRAIYDYQSQADDQISFKDGDILCVIEKPVDDDWWKAKRKGDALDDDEPIGLVPSNYIEEAKPIGTYKTLYDYTQQTEEELSFTEDVMLKVYDLSDPDWALVGLNGSFGFAPANYIEKVEGTAQEPSQPPVPAIQIPTNSSKEPPSPVREGVHFEEPPRETPDTPSPVQESPHIASQHPPPRSLSVPTSASPPISPDMNRSTDRGAHHSSHQSEHQRRQQSRISHRFSDSDSDDGPSLPYRRPRQLDEHPPSSPRVPPGYRTWPVQEVDSKKKRAATLGLGNNNVMLLPDKSSRPMEEWSIDNMTAYNYEGKHVFLEFVKPAKSLDLHAGSTNTAEEIVLALGEMRGVRKAVGLDEVVAAATEGAKRKNIGTILYEFKAQGEDEVSVLPGDEVVILDDTAHEWWLVRRQVNGMEGVVPSTYVERGRKQIPITTGAGIRESPGVPRKKMSRDLGGSDVPERRSSLPPQSHNQNRKSAQPRARPNSDQVRTWTDRTGSFRVDAEFLGCRDGKIHLHKINGVKIAVPISKMSIEDIHYVEKRTGQSLDEDKPLSEIMKEQRRRSQQTPQAGIAIDKSANRSRSPGTQTSAKNDYDWFDFFLSCGVDVNDCQRYALSFQKDNMDESVLPDITPEIMRSLGLKAGDVLRVNKKLEQKFGGAEKHGNANGGLFSEAGGVLKTSRSRPTAPIQTGSVVDPKAFESQGEGGSTADVDKSPQPASAREDDFGDSAWVVKPSKHQPESQGTPKIEKTPDPEPQTAPKPAETPLPTQIQPTQAPLSGALKDMASLSLSTPPLQPTKASAVTPPVSTVSPNIGANGDYNVQQPNVNSSIFGQPSIQTSGPPATSQLNVNYSGPTGRTRPAPPPVNNSGALGVPPPPISRPASVPSTITSPLPMLPNYTGMMGPTGASFSANSSQMVYPLPLQQPMTTGIGSFSPGLQMQSTGMGYQTTGYAQPSIPQFQQPQQQVPMQPQMTGMNMAPIGPFLGASAPSSFVPNQRGINSLLPPALAPQPAQPLKPQQTGPPPPVRFGVQQKLKPQPTGKADLSKATPDNPFGF